MSHCVYVCAQHTRVCLCSLVFEAPDRSLSSAPNYGRFLEIWLWQEMGRSLKVGDMLQDMYLGPGRTLGVLPEGLF